MIRKQRFMSVPGQAPIEISPEDFRKAGGKLNKEQVLKTFRQKNRSKNLNQPSNNPQPLTPPNTPANQPPTTDKIKIKAAFIAYSDKIVKEYARDAADRKLSNDFKAENNKGFFGKIGHFFKKV